MPTIELVTQIHAPIERCFDLARSIDLHIHSTNGTEEKAIAGITSGLIGKGEFVTWSARHFGIKQQLTTRITGFEYPTFFCDEMEKGAFKRIHHEHRFEAQSDYTLMNDRFEYDSPFGIIGQIFNSLMLHSYLEKLIQKRNSIIKEFAEGDKWKEILS